MCHANCIDGKIRLCIIRGKFRGRGKRENKIDAGSWILIGKRDWETEKPQTNDSGMADLSVVVGKCDLLEVYNDYDIERLKKSVNENWSMFNYAISYGTDSNKMDAATLNNEIDFTSEQTGDFYENLMKETAKGAAVNKISLNNSMEEEEINVDDL